MSNPYNISSTCILGEEFANNIGLLIIVIIKVFISIIGFVMTAKVTACRYRLITMHRNLKILLYFVHYFAVYLLCLTIAIPNLYSAIKFIVFKLSNAADPCLLVKQLLEMSNATCLIIRIVSLFAIYLLALSIMTIAIERTIATVRFQTYETFGIRIAILLAVAVV
jgi:hypothetical protein